MSDNVRTGAFTRTLSFGRHDRDPVQPRFHMEAVEDKLASQEQGRPIFRQEERVQFLIPGSPNQPVFRVSDEHRQRWPEQYAAFKRGEEMAITGTPLEQWPILKRTQVLELKALQIFTVEQCAELSDAHIQRLGLTGHRLKERAAAYLDEAAQLALTEQLAADSDRKDAQIAALERQVAEMSALVQQISARQIAEGDRPHPIATHVPAEHDPFARPALAQEPAAQSSLADLPPVRKRGQKEAA